MARAGSVCVLGSFESWKFFWPYRIGQLGSLGPAEFASL